MPTVQYDQQKQYWEGIDKRRHPNHPNHPVVKAFAQAKLDFILKTLRLSRSESKQMTMLEVGAGNGYFSASFDDAFELTSLDFSPNMLEMNPLPPEQKVVGDAEALDFEDSSFDIVFCGNLLHHLEDPVVAVREMKRVAGKYVVLVEPNIQNPLMFMFGALKPEERGSLKFTGAYMRKLGQRAGLELRGFTSQGAILPNKAPRLLLPLLRHIDGHSPVHFYHIAVFEKQHKT